MRLWRDKAREYGEFTQAAVQKEITEDNVRRYCDCLRDIVRQARGGGSLPVDITPWVEDANELAVKLGLTHPDWILALNIDLLPYVENDAVRDLPLPWNCDKPPVTLRGRKSLMVGAFYNADPLPNVEELINKAQSLLREETTEAPMNRRIATLIASGEGATLEFKSSARWDRKADRANKVLEQVIVKTVAALLNSEGARF